MPNVFHAVIKGLRGSWSSGLATLDVEQDGHRLGPLGDSRPPVRALDAALSLAQSWGYDPKAARQEEPGEDGNYLPGGETFTGEEDPEEADFNFEFDRDDNDEPVEDSGQGYNDTHSYTRHIEGN